MTYKGKKPFLGNFESFGDAVKSGEEAVDMYHGAKDKEEQQ